MTEKRFSPAFKTYSRKFKHSFTLGVYPTLEMLKTVPDKALKVVFSTDCKDNDGVIECIHICEKEGIPFEFNDVLLNRISIKENTYAIGAFEKFEGKIEAEQDHVVLVEPRDMGNIGTIIRTMAAFNVKNLALIRPAADIFDPKVVRSAMGSLFTINFQYFDNFTNYHRTYKKHELYPFVIDTRAPAITKVPFAQLKSLVFGNEGHGLPVEITSKGTRVRIPQASQVDSLNLSVAAGIALWEVYGRI